MQPQTTVLIVAIIAVVVVCFVVTTHYYNQAEYYRSLSNQYMSQTYQEQQMNQEIKDCIAQYEYTNSMPCQYDWHYNE